MRFGCIVASGLVVVLGCGDGADPGDGSTSAWNRDPGAAQPPPCSGVPIASGVLRTSLGDVALDGEPAFVRVFYKHDADAFEGGCVRRLQIGIGAFDFFDGGCYLTLTFDTAAPHAGLRGVGFDVGDRCAGFPDALEGTYSRGGPVYFEAAGGAMTVIQDQASYDPRWPDGLATTLAIDTAASEACLEDVTLRFPSMAYALVGGRAETRVIHVDLGEVVVTGDVRAYADPLDLACEPIASSCLAGTHRGGDGMCVPMETCSPGYAADSCGDCTPVEAVP